MPPSLANAVRVPVSTATPSVSRFVAVDVQVPTSPAVARLTPDGQSPTMLTPAATAPSTITLTLRLPHGVESTVAGLDADAVTLLVLEIVSSAARAGAC